MLRTLLSAFLIGTVVSACSYSAGDNNTVPVRSLDAPDGTTLGSFTWIGSVRELAVGTVIIADVRENRLMLGDFQTGLTEVVGQIGEGPNEYRQVGRLWAIGGDSTLMVDRGANRLLGFVGRRLIGTLSPGESLPTMLPEFIRIYGADEIGGVVTLVTPRDENPTRSLLAVRYDRRTGTVDTLARLADSKIRFAVPASGGVVPTNPRFIISLETRDQIAVFPDGWIAIVRRDPYVVDWCPPAAGCSSSRRALVAPRRLTDADRVAYLAMANAQATWPPTSSINQTVGWPEWIPPFVPPAFPDGSAAFALPDGRLLVQRIPSSKEPAMLYDIVDRRGRVVERLRLAANQRVVDFGGSSVYVTVTNDVGLQRLQRHPWP